MSSASEVSTVFISYAHSSDAHRQTVQKLAHDLKDCGLNVVIDTDVTPEFPQGPVGGWPLWMEAQVESATWVLLVFDDVYRDRFNHKVDSGAGLGVAWEARLIRSEIYQKRSQNKKFIPLLVGESSVELLPTLFRDQTFWRIPQATKELADALKKPPAETELVLDGQIDSVPDPLVALHDAGANQYRVYTRSRSSFNKSLSKRGIAFLRRQARVALLDGDASLASLIHEGTRGDNVGLPDSKHQAMGLWLFGQAVSGFKEIRDEQESLHLRFLMPDMREDFIWQSTLPWQTLYRDGHYLIQSEHPWSVSLLSQLPSLRAVEFPEAPRILVIAPQPRGKGATQHEIHLQELTREFRVALPDVPIHEAVTFVRTWQQFNDAVTSKDFDVVYFYGIGLGSKHQFRLAFADDQNNPVEVTAEQLAAVFRTHQEKLGKPISLVFLNFTTADPEGVASAGWDLHTVCPCVVLNRTTVRQDVARKLGTVFLRLLLRDGLPPHEAATRIIDFVGEFPRVEKQAIHWVVPMVHANYTSWNSSRRPRVFEIDPSWELKLDRTPHMSLINQKVRDVWFGNQVKRSRYQAICFLWYGEEGQGMRHLHERVSLELGDRDRLIVLNPRWPESIRTSVTERRSPIEWHEKLLEAFDVTRMDDLESKLRQTANNQDYVVLSFPHVTREDIKFLKPPLVMEFLRWLDGQFLEIFDKVQVRFLLLVSFQAADGKTEDFRKKVSEDYRGLSLKHLQVNVLEPLGPLQVGEIRDFLDENGLSGVYEDISQLDLLHQKTNGNYEKTVIELERVVLYGEALPTSENEKQRDPENDEY